MQVANSIILFVPSFGKGGCLRYLYILVYRSAINCSWNCLSTVFQNTLHTPLDVFGEKGVPWHFLGRTCTRAQHISQYNAQATTYIPQRMCQRSPITIPIFCKVVFAPVLLNAENLHDDPVCILTEASTPKKGVFVHLAPGSAGTPYKRVYWYPVWKGVLVRSHRCTSTPICIPYRGVVVHPCRCTNTPSGEVYHYALK